MAGSLAGLTKFHAERRSVSGTSREEYKGSREENVREPWGVLCVVYMASYFRLSLGDMYQSKPSFRPGVSSSSSSEGGMGEKEGWEPERARVACTRWAFDSGTSQSGNEGGTSAYSCVEDKCELGY